MNKETGGILFKRSDLAGAAIDVPCGQCLGCRLDHSRLWAIRMVHEASLHDENCFITLTYSPENLPADGSLNKKHFQDFMKRLRKKFSHRRIRYYQCGEYGAQLSRPHYHACLFGLDFHDHELLKKEDDYEVYTSKVLSDLWGLGFCTFTAFSFETAAYCARYVTKKVTGHNAPDHYMRVDDDGVCYWLEPEYSTMSRGHTCKKHRGKPYQVNCKNCSRGLGRDWFEMYYSDCFPSDEVPVPGIGVLPSVPRYYTTVLKNDDLDQYEEIKKRRKVFRDNHADEYTPHRLWQKYKVKLDQIATLTRGYENET